MLSLRQPLASFILMIYLESEAPKVLMLMLSDSLPHILYTDPKPGPQEDINIYIYLQNTRSFWQLGGSRKKKRKQKHRHYQLLKMQCATTEHPPSK